MNKWKSNIMKIKNKKKKFFLNQFLKEVKKV